MNKAKNSVQYCLFWKKKKVCSLASTFPLFEHWFIVYYSKKKKKACHVILWDVVADESLQSKLLVSHAHIISTSNSIFNSTMQKKDQKKKGVHYWCGDFETVVVKVFPNICFGPDLKSSCSSLKCRFLMCGLQLREN